LLLLDEIAGGLSEHESHELVETIRAIHARGTTIVWIEHIVHALVSMANRVKGDNLRADPGPGRAARRDGGGARQGSLHGDPSLMTLLQTRGLCAFYGDFQALFDIDVAVEEGDTVAVIGANGAGKTTFL